METEALTTSCSACLICGRGGQASVPLGGQPAIHPTPCCSNTFCTACLKATAAAAGRLFRCPACRDEREFLGHAKALGVKVLDLTPAYAKDAGNALMVVVKACSAARCRSPRGRDFDASNISSTRSVDLSAWRLVSCLSCGGSAVHAGCSATPSALVWRCDTCGGDGDLPSAGVEEEAFVPFRRGDKVEARFKGGPRWYGGTIVGGNAADGYRVRYDDDGLLETVPRLARIRRPAAPPDPAGARQVRAPPRPAAYEAAESVPDQEPRGKPEAEEPLDAVDEEADYSSQYVGVCYVGRLKEKPWYSQIDSKSLGSFATQKEAARAYDSQARILGRPVNFPAAGETQAVKAKKRKAKPATGGGDAPAEKKPRLQAFEPVVEGERRASLVGRRCQLLSAERANQCGVVVKDYCDDKPRAFLDVVTLRLDSGGLERRVPIAALAAAPEAAEEPEDDEERYCFCRDVSHGTMVCCSVSHCRAWYHVSCLDMAQEPPKGVWSCPACVSARLETAATKKRQPKRVAKVQRAPGEYRGRAAARVERICAQRGIERFALPSAAAADEEEARHEDAALRREADAWWREEEWAYERWRKEDTANAWLRYHEARRREQDAQREQEARRREQEEQETRWWAAYCQRQAEAQRREEAARRAAAAVDAAASVAADGAFEAAVAARLHAVDDALGDLEALLRGPYGGAARAGLGALVAPTAARHLALYREQPIPWYGARLSDDVALVKYLARASDEDARKASTAIVLDLSAQAPRLLLSPNSSQNFCDSITRLRSPSDALLDAVARREFPDLHQFGTGADASAHRAAALNYIQTAMAKRPKRARADPQ